MSLNAFSSNRFAESRLVQMSVPRLIQNLNTFLISHVWVRIGGAQLLGETIGHIESAHMVREVFE